MSSKLNAAARLKDAASKPYVSSIKAASKPYDSEAVSQELDDAKDSLVRAIEKCNKAKGLALPSSQGDLDKLVKDLTKNLKELRRISEDV